MDKISRYIVDSAVIEGNVQLINAASVKLTRYNEYLKNRYRSGFSIEGSGVSGFPLYDGINEQKLETVRNVMEKLLTNIETIDQREEKYE